MPIYQPHDLLHLSLPIPINQSLITVVSTKNTRKKTAIHPVDGDIAAIMEQVVRVKRRTGGNTVIQDIIVWKRVRGMQVWATIDGVHMEVKGPLGPNDI